MYKFVLALVISLALTACGGKVEPGSQPDADLTIASGSVSACGTTITQNVTSETIDGKPMVKDVTVSISGSEASTIKTNQTTTLDDILVAFLDGRLKVWCPD